MEIYFCRSCRNRFEAVGTKNEWIDPTFGPCSKLVAKCPACGQECDEYRAPRQGTEKEQPHSNPVPPCRACCGGCEL